MIPVRYIVAAALLFFAWKGATLEFPWPPAGAPAIKSPRPDAATMAWAKEAGAKARTMLHTDRLYLAKLYDAMAFVIRRDGDRSDPIIKSNDEFVSFHAASLRLAIDKESVGKYPGLGEAIDQAFVSAIGTDSVPLDADTRRKLIDACAALSWTFTVGGDG